MNSTRSLLENSTFCWYWLSTFLAGMGWMIQWVAVTWMMVEIDGRPEMVGLVQTCLSIPVIFFAMPAGALSDLFGRKAVVMPAQTLIVLAVLLLVYLIASQSLNVPWLLALAFVLGGARERQPGVAELRVPHRPEAGIT